MPKVTNLLELAEFIIAAQDLIHAVSAFAFTLDLHHLDHRFESRAQGRFFTLSRQWQFGVLGAKQLTIGEVRVVWNGNGLAARARFIALLK